MSVEISEGPKTVQQPDATQEATAVNPKTPVATVEPKKEGFSPTVEDGQNKCAGCVRDYNI